MLKQRGHRRSQHDRNGAARHGAQVSAIASTAQKAQAWALPVANNVVTVAEAEGLTLVLPEQQAVDAGLSVLFRAAWITLTVHSDLQAVGLTAAFAGALGRAGVSCNVVAGAYHDHIFVPAEQASRAMAALRELQQAAAHNGF